MYIAEITTNASQSFISLLVVDIEYWQFSGAYNHQTNVVLMTIFVTYKLLTSLN